MDATDKPAKPTKANPRHMRTKPQAIAESTGKVTADLLPIDRRQIRVLHRDVPMTAVYITAGGVHVKRGGNEHTVYRWGDDPGLYCPR